MAKCESWALLPSYALICDLGAETSTRGRQRPEKASRHSVWISWDRSKDRPRKILSPYESYYGLLTKIDALRLDIGLISLIRYGRVPPGGLWEHALGSHSAQKSLEFKAEDVENRNRRNNLQIIGVREGTEGQDPVGFAEQLLPQAPFSPYFTVERAHKIPSTRGPTLLSCACCIFTIAI